MAWTESGDMIKQLNYKPNQHDSLFTQSYSTLCFNHDGTVKSKQVASAAELILADTSVENFDTTLPERLRAVLKHSNLPEPIFSHILNKIPADVLLDPELYIMPYLLSHPQLTEEKFKALLNKANTVQLEDLHKAVKVEKSEAAYRLTYPVKTLLSMFSADKQIRSFTRSEHLQAQLFYLTILRCEHALEKLMHKVGLSSNEPEYM